jgi:pyruvate,water dikinase
VLGLIGEADSMLGGEYLFDRSYLYNLAADLEQALNTVQHELAAITGKRYDTLGAAVDRVVSALQRSIDPKSSAAGAPLIVPFEEIGTDIAGMVGEKMARLGEIRERLDLRVPAGFVVTVRASALLLSREPIARRLSTLASGEETAATGDLERLVATAEVPGPVRSAIRKALSAWPRSARFAVRSSAMGEDGQLSFAGQFRTELNVPRDSVAEAWREVVASLFSPGALEYRRRNRIPPADASMAVGCTTMVPAIASGVAYSLDPNDPRSDLVVVSAARGLGVMVVEGRGAADRFLIQRHPPHDVTSRVIAIKREMVVPSAERGVETAEVPEAERAAASLPDAALAALAEAVVRIERHLGAPQDVEWAVDEEGTLVILQARPLRIPDAPESRPAPQARSELASRVLLAGSGEIGCRGVGAGRVFVVDASESLEGFQAGEVLVARYASPTLSSAVARAAAVVTEVGAVTGHLATVARECRVPMIVNAQGAAHVLGAGQVVTVDADKNVVYDGEIEELVLGELLHGRSFQEFREFRILREMLRHISPLNLKDPSDARFTPENCQTCHDIIRFAHEKAMAEISRLDSPWLSGGEDVYQLDLDVPLDLVVVNIGGGVEVLHAKQKIIDRSAITSAPLKILLDGLATPGVWSTNPADMDTEGLMASATRGGPLTTPGAGVVLHNIAIVSADYLNLSIRVGFHFNVVDCFLGHGAEDSYVAFRFVGGVTEMARRMRRGRLLSAILRYHGFLIEQKADLVVGRLKAASRPLAEQRLRMIGRLIGFTRQLDILLRDDEIVERLAQRFLEEKYEIEPWE